MSKKDLKEGLSSARKADITHMRTPFLVYGSRACEYGDQKYERANYARPMPNIQEDFKRLRAYLRAVISHVLHVLDQMEYHQSLDYELQDVKGMLEACYAEDTDTKPGQEIGASGLPHLCGAVASLNLAITQAVRAGLLPEDPGTPWRDQEVIEPEPPQAHLVQEEDGAYTLYATDFDPVVTIRKDSRGIPKVTIEDKQYCPANGWWHDA